jgi:hypothetical protein
MLTAPEGGDFMKLILLYPKELVYPQQGSLMYVF